MLQSSAFHQHVFCLYQGYLKLKKPGLFPYKWKENTNSWCMCRWTVLSCTLWIPDRLLLLCTIDFTRHSKLQDYFGQNQLYLLSNMTCILRAASNLSDQDLNLILSLWSCVLFLLNFTIAVTYLGLEGAHIEEGQEVEHHGALSRVEAVKRMVMLLNLT